MRQESIKLLLNVALVKKWMIFQMDVKTAFLNGNLEEEVYVQQPQGCFDLMGEKHHF